jgi:hypothetical protein
MLTSVALIGAPLNAQTTLNIPGNANIYGAGHATPPAPGGGGAGTLPPMVTFTAGSFSVLTFSSVAGTVTLNVGSGDNSNDGDGFGAASTDSSANAFNVISGISGPFAGWLVGVFETDTEPTDPPPASLDFNTIDINFTMLSPAINQLFFIGDALSGHGSGSVQQFAVPENATRLFLGISDAPGYHGAAGAYDDNAGSFVATFNIPEPAVPALLMFALAAMLVQWPRRLR